MVFIKSKKGSAQARKFEEHVPRRGLPAFLLLDDQGQVVASWHGYTDPRNFVAILNNHIEENKKT